MNASLARLNFLFLSPSLTLLFLHQILICGIYILLYLRKFWGLFQIELVEENFYAASIASIKLRLEKLRNKDK